MPDERRKDTRIDASSPGRFYNEGSGVGGACVVSNLSNGGAKILVAHDAAVTDNFKLKVTPHSPLRECSVVWRSGDAVGVQFIQPWRTQG